MNTFDLALKVFINELLKQAQWIEHSASNSYFQVVYVDDIKELAQKYGVEIDE